MPPTVGSDSGNLNDGLCGGLFAYFAPAGIATQWYWPPGDRGKLWRWLHGHPTDEKDGTA